MVTTRLLLVSVAAALVSAPVVASAASEAVVGVKIAELRIKPDDSAFSRLKIPGGREVSLLGKSDDGRWIKVRTEIEKAGESIKLEGWLEAAQLKGDTSGLSVASGGSSSGSSSGGSWDAGSSSGDSWDTSTPAAAEAAPAWGDTPAEPASSGDSWDLGGDSEPAPAATDSWDSGSASADSSSSSSGDTWDSGSSSDSGSGDTWDSGSSDSSSGDSWESSDSGSSDSSSDDGW